MPKMMLRVLKAPYFTNPSPGYRIRQAMAFGLFVFLFLYIFQPFGIHQMNEPLLWVAAGFGAVTFLAMLFLNILIPPLFRGYFQEERWTVGKELFYTLLNIWLIGLANFLFFNYFFTGRFSLSSFLWFQFATVTIGIFPVAAIVLFRESRSRKRYTREAGLLSGRLKEDASNKRSPENDIVIIPSQNSNEDLTVTTDNLLYLQAADNYVEICFMKETLKKKMVRNTLKSLNEILQAHRQFYRCHKSYIVNLDRVSRISGNAQGYKLHFAETDQVVPVSRQNNDTIKERLFNRP